MTQYICKRLLLMIPTLLGAAVFVFLLMRLIPGDVCELRLAGEGAYVDEKAIQICREQAGLTRPLAGQFVDWVWGLVRGISAFPCGPDDRSPTKSACGFSYRCKWPSWPR